MFDWALSLEREREEEMVGAGLDELTLEQRREILQMIVEQIVIDRDNNVDITLAIPIDEDSPESDSVAIASESSWPRRSPGGCGRPLPGASG